MLFLFFCFASPSASTIKAITSSGKVRAVTPSSSSVKAGWVGISIDQFVSLSLVPFFSLWFAYKKISNEKKNSLYERKKEKNYAEF